MTRSTQVSIRLPATDTAAIDELVKAGEYPNRTALVAAAIRRLLDDARERLVAEQYRRAYGDQHELADDEAWVLEAGRQSLSRDR